MRLLAIILLLLTCSGNIFASGDSAAGKTMAIICIGCHGYDGNSDNPVYPRLAGQGEDYLAKQLHDFKSGARKEEHMTSMVEAIEISDIQNIAAYFSSQKRKPVDAGKVDTSLGKRIFQSGIKSKDVAACASCHGTKALGNTAAKFPLLAGQHVEYVVKMLKEFRIGTRSNDLLKIMRNVVAKLSDKEIHAVASYVAGLK